MPTKGAPSQFSELGIDLMVVQDGFWIRIMSKSQLILRIELIMKLFFWTFCKKNLQIFQNHILLAFTVKQVEFLLVFQSLAYFLVCHSLLK